MADFSRRHFIGASAALACAAPCLSAETGWKKALIQGLPTEQSLQPLKEAGFDGIECTAWDATPAEAENARKAADALGMKIHSVMRAWVSMTEPENVAESVESVEKALETAHILGADSILLVPGKTRVQPIPRPWEFDIHFNPETAQVSKVITGDNAPYKAYIDAQSGHRNGTKRTAATHSFR